MNTSEICRMLGIRRKLGNNWRNGWKHRDLVTGKVRYYPPIDEVPVVTTVSARFLSEDERVTRQTQSTPRDRPAQDPIQRCAHDP
ncbi:hypothetical protein [Leifsonia xyli]|uniref:hypothetical protein n=1 Tax=Leifsonia xyli TaxID=1575 RepID=UPI00191C07B6|nr:hypothetical protein [Leifsonia xyli]